MVHVRFTLEKCSSNVLSQVEEKFRALDSRELEVRINKAWGSLVGSQPEPAKMHAKGSVHVRRTYTCFRVTWRIKLNICN